jgi:glycosyltransferase involved in cell wall biosynthesis
VSDKAGDTEASPFGRVVHYYRRALAPPGSEDDGLTAAVWRWACDLAAAGVPVALAFDPAIKGRQPASAGIEMVPVRHWGAWRLRVPMGLPRELRAGDLLVLHWGHVVHNVVAGWAARRAQVPYVVVPHGAYARRARARRAWLKVPFYLAFEHRLLRGSIAAHVFFAPEAEDVAELAPTMRFVVAPTATDLRTDTRWDGGTGGYVSWIGRYDIAHKGLDILLEAVAGISVDRRPRLRLHGVDSVDRRQDVAALAEALGVTSYVDVGGPVYGTDKDSFLTGAITYVHPSRWESHSGALVENLALGVPTVVSATMPVASLLGDADAAVVVGPGPAALAAGIDEARRRANSLSAAGRRFVAEYLAAESVTTSWLTQVRALLLQPRPRARDGPRPWAYRQARSFR